MTGTDEVTTDLAPTLTPRRRRRSHPALLALVAIGVSATAVMTGASVSASTMPEPQPPRADVVTLGTFDGTNGYECTFTGKDAEELTAQIVPSTGTVEAVPPQTADGSPIPADVVPAEPLPAGAVVVSGETADGGPIDAMGTEAGAGAGVEGPAVAMAAPAGDAPMVNVDGEATKLRPGTDEECSALVQDATDAKR